MHGHTMDRMDRTRANTGMPVNLQPGPIVTRRRRYACNATRPDIHVPSGQQGPALPLQAPVEPIADQHDDVRAFPRSPTTGWWGHVGSAVSVAALTSSILLGTCDTSHALQSLSTAPTATYAPTQAAGQPKLNQQSADGSIALATQPDKAGLTWHLDQSAQGVGNMSYLGHGAEVQATQDLASEAEDKLLEAVRQIEARVDSALGAVVQSGPRLPFSNILGVPTATTKEDQEKVNATARMLISEVWEVVDQNYLDARSTGWDRARWQQLRDNALDKTYTDTLAAYRAIREMMAWGLSDPYCRFITPDELAVMKKYDVTGIGLNLGTGAEFTLKTGRPLPMSRPADNTGVFVVGISKGSPADKVGVRQGDELIEVDGVPLAYQSPFQAASLIAGQQADTEGPSPSQRPFVELKVRKIDGMTSMVQVERPVRMLTSPVSSSLAKGQSEPVGLLRLSSFNARAQRDLAAAINKLQEQGAKSLVLDLRDNRGGLVSEGLEVARLFLDGDAPIVYTESRSIPRDAPRATGPPLTRLPLLVLVNEHTASASEIVAGALHDNCRAVLVGSRTYGKGLIQSVYELSDGSGMVLTVGKYLTPNRTDIDRSGIQPDFSAKPSPRLAAETLEACRINRQTDVEAGSSQTRM